MKRTLVAVSPLHAKFRGYLSPRGYTLCLGAGVSREIAPTWLSLSNAIVNEAFGANYSEGAFTELIGKSGWPLDAWIQAAANELLLRGNSMADIASLIESHLYSSIREKARGLGLEKYLKLFS